jgi:quercetin dioxygenase-like cupin family protein
MDATGEAAPANRQAEIAREAAMFGKRAALVGLVGIGLGMSAVAAASATAGSGFSSLLIGSGQADHSFTVHQKKGNDVVTTQNTIAPGGFSGWHSHPGVAVIVVQAGQLTLYSEPVGGGRCTSETYTAGQVFLERPHDQENAVNNGTVPTVVAVTFFNVPHGGSARIDRANPGDCPG